MIMITLDGIKGGSRRNVGSGAGGSAKKPAVSDRFFKPGVEGTHGIAWANAWRPVSRSNDVEVRSYNSIKDAQCRDI